jgi:hypothetical protein
MFSYNEVTIQEDLFYLPEYIQDEQTEPHELIKKIEYFIEDILVKLDEGEELEIFLIDLEQNCVFNYDLGYYTLPEGPDNVKYSKINLLNNSEKITKMLKVASIIHNKTMNNSYSTKR